VRVAKLEDKTNVHWNFESMIRYAREDRFPGVDNVTTAFDWRQRIYLQGEVNDKVAYGARLQAAAHRFGTTGNERAAFNQAYLSFKDIIGLDGLTIGRFDTTGATNGLLNGKSGNNDGLKLAKKFGAATFSAMSTDLSQNSEVVLYNLDYRASDAVKLNVGYQVGNWSGAPYGPLPWLAYGVTKSTDVGLQAKFGDLRFTAEYVKTKIKGSIPGARPVPPKGWPGPSSTRTSAGRAEAITGPGYSAAICSSSSEPAAQKSRPESGRLGLAGQFFSAAEPRSPMDSTATRTFPAKWSLVLP